MKEIGEPPERPANEKICTELIVATKKVVRPECPSEDCSLNTCCVGTTSRNPCFDESGPKHVEGKPDVRIFIEVENIMNGPQDAVREKCIKVEKKPQVIQKNP